MTHSNIKNDPSNVTVIVYCLPSIEVCVHKWRCSDTHYWLVKLFWV